MRLFIDITAHGWGHLSQTAPIMNVLRTRNPDLELVVRSGIDASIVVQKLGPLSGYYTSDTDFGLVMQGPFVVNRTATLGRYSLLHDHLDEHIESLAALIRMERCDAVFSNVGYLAVAAARRARLPVVVCSSLNWCDVFAAYCGDLDGAGKILSDMRAAYRSADLFVRLAPGMSMSSFKTHPVLRPIANVGQRSRAALANAIGVGAGSALVLCAFGGMLPAEPPPFVHRPEGLTILGPSAWSRYGVIPVDSLSLAYADVLASVDSVVTKPGYGVVAELGCTGTPAIMISRGEWPEEPYLLDWLAKHGGHMTLNTIDGLSAQMVKDWIAEQAAVPVSKAQRGGEEDVARLVTALLDD